ncbi:hypothetical protein P7C73_g3151, partial [Tremellales sp. Uapishka_1]
MTARDARILVVGGAGTMGSSTALELARRGYTNVHILDIFPPPSANSAGNDMNKMISTQYVDGIWGRLAFEAWDAWKQDPLFAPFLHATGRVDLASADNITRLKSLRKQLDLSVSAGRPDNVQWLDSVADILAKAPYLRDGSIDGWKGLWVKDAGWMAAREALNAVGVEAKHLGVKGTFGPTGTFKSLLLGPDGKQCVGVETIDGTKWPADLVILATGAWSPTLIDLEGQCESKCWQFGHIQLTPEETAAFQNTPAMYNGGLLSTADRDLWRWRPERERKVDGARDGPVPKDLGDLSGWCHD